MDSGNSVIKNEKKETKPRQKETFFRNPILYVLLLYQIEVPLRIVVPVGKIPKV